MSTITKLLPIEERKTVRLEKIREAGERLNKRSQTQQQIEESANLVCAMAAMKHALRRIEDVFDDCLDARDWKKAREVITAIHLLAGERRYTARGNITQEK